MSPLVTPDGAPLALHDLVGREPAPPLLIVHANGFHGRAYRPLAEALAPDFHTFAVDLRGHGDTPATPGWIGSHAPIDWRLFGDDVLHVARALAARSGDGTITGFGHSLGGAALLLAAHRDPHPFDRLVLFEPITPPPLPGSIDPETLPLVIAARRRRRRFDSFEAAASNFAAKPPLSSMTPEALHEYVTHGFATDAYGGVELRCHPDVEAGIFAGSLSNGVWDLLPQITVPVLVIAGKVVPGQASAFAEPASERLPQSTFIEVPHLSHFGPLEDPAQVARVTRGARHLL